MSAARCAAKGCPVRGKCPWHTIDSAPDPQVVALTRHSRRGGTHTRDNVPKGVRTEMRRLLSSTGLWDADDPKQVEQGRRVGAALGSDSLRRHLAAV